jgi:hypothetical protein
MNHRWKDNVCIKCGLKRKMRYWRQLMAIVNHPPWEAYMTGTCYFYWIPGDKTMKKERPDCI